MSSTFLSFFEFLSFFDLIQAFDKIYLGSLRKRLFIRALSLAVSAATSIILSCLSPSVNYFFQFFSFFIFCLLQQDSTRLKFTVNSSGRRQPKGGLRCAPAAFWKRAGIPLADLYPVHIDRLRIIAYHQFTDAVVKWKYGSK